MRKTPGVYDENWQNKAYSFYSHRECEFFPCHETADYDSFNCLFCFCPLFTFDETCGGNYSITSQGVKDCSNCILPHKRENYGYIKEKISLFFDKTGGNI